MRITVPSRVGTRPIPLVMQRVWPTAGECQLVQAPNVKRTRLAT